MERRCLGANIVTFQPAPIRLSELTQTAGGNQEVRNSILAAIDSLVEQGHSEFSWSTLLGEVIANGCGSSADTIYAVLKADVIGRHLGRKRRGVYAPLSADSLAPTSSRGEVLAAIEAFRSRTGREEFRFADVWAEMQGSPYSKATVRTVLGFFMTGGSQRRSSRHVDVVRVRRGVFKLRSATTGEIEA